MACGTLTKTQIWRKCSGFIRLLTTQEKGISNFGSIPWMRTSFNLVSASSDGQQHSTFSRCFSSTSSSFLVLLSSSEGALDSSSSSILGISSSIKVFSTNNSGRRAFTASRKVKHLSAAPQIQKAHSIPKSCQCQHLAWYT